MCPCPNRDFLLYPDPFSHCQTFSVFVLTLNPFFLSVLPQALRNALNFSVFSKILALVLIHLGQIDLAPLCVGCHYQLGELLKGGSGFIVDVKCRKSGAGASLAVSLLLRSLRAEEDSC